MKLSSDKDFKHYIYSYNLNLILLYGNLFTLYTIVGIFFFDQDRHMIIPSTIVLTLFFVLVLLSLWVQRYKPDESNYFKWINIFYFAIIYLTIVLIGLNSTRYEFIYFGLLTVMLFSAFLYVKPIINTCINLVILSLGVWVLLMTNVTLVHILTLLLVTLSSTYGSYTHYSHLKKHQSDILMIKDMGEMLEHVSKRDVLTNLYNNTYISDQLKFELGRARRYQTPLCLLLLDIDNFQAINNDFGQVSGDETLSTIANILSKTCRSTDIIGRFSGGEFIVLLPNTSLDESIILAERLRLIISTNDFEIGRKITTSIGLSENNNHSADSLIKACQLNIQVAKSEGKNQVYY